MPSPQSLAATRSVHAAALLAALVVLLPAQAALAGHHRWDFSEVFSNEDGTVQFVELFSANSGEAALNGWTITSTSGTFTFVGNLPADTANTWVLVGTAAYALAEGAVAPDYVLPDAFFDPAGDTLNYAGGADIWTVSDVPTNGVDSLDRASGAGPNTPTNFAGETGSIDVSSPGGGSELPGLGVWGIVALIGILLAVASGLFREPSTPIDG